MTPVRIDHRPFSSLAGPSKFCLGCRTEKACAKEFWTGRNVWINMVVEVEGEGGAIGYMTDRQRHYLPGAQCRACTNQRKKDNRLVHKAMRLAETPEMRAEIEATLKGPCGVCGHASSARKGLVEYGVVILICIECRSGLDQARETEDPLACAKSAWAAFAKHNAVERGREAEMRSHSDRVHYKAHNRPDTKAIAFPHVVCLVREVSWRHVMAYLAKHREDPVEE